MNLHITHDNVFIDYIIGIARELNVSHDKFVVYTFEELEKLKHVKSNNVFFAKHNSEKFRNVIGDLKQYRNIYIHWLEGPSADFVNQIPKSINVIWCFWGGDGLELKHIQQNVFQAKSLKYFKKHLSNSILDDLNSTEFVFNLRKKFRSHLAFKNHLNAIARVDYFAHYLTEDYEIVNAATKMKAKFIPFHYAAIEDIVPVNEASKPIDSNNILIGNSDTLSNNHFEAIDALAGINLNDSKVYCPLSYEGVEYAEAVAAYGKEKLGSNFFPLLNFLPKEEYDQMLAGINVAIMNHNRSQALGNIFVLLWKGAKLFMSDSSPLFHYLKMNKCKVLSLIHI